METESFCVVERGTHRIRFVDKSLDEMGRSVAYDASLDVAAVLVHGSSIFISDSKSHTIIEIDMDSGATIRTIGSGRGSLPGQLINPLFLTLYTSPFSDSDHQIIVSDSNNNRICAFNLTSGEYLRSFEANLQVPMGIDIWFPSSTGSGGGELLVGDYCGFRVVVFDFISGTCIRTIGEKGRGPGKFDAPCGITSYLPPGGRDEEAIVLVTDFNHHNVQVFNLLSGAFLRVIGSGFGKGVNQFSSPWTIVVIRSKEDRALLVVSDSMNRRLPVFDLESGAHMTFVGAGLGAGTEIIQSPLGLWVVNRGDHSGPYPYVLK